MPLPDQTPRLPKWPFLIGYAATIVAIWLIADRSGTPMSTESVIAIAFCGCVALVVAIPFLADYARRQDEALDERQRSLESLARTISTAAEQISIAAGGFNEIAELAQKNIRHAEQLPQKLHEKITEFQARLVVATDEEKEELERELAALRSSESEKLESTADKIARAAADWAKIESAAQKQFNATKTLLAQFEENVSRFERKAVQFEGGVARLGAELESAEAVAPIPAAPKHASRSERRSPAPEPVPVPPVSEPEAVKKPETAVPPPEAPGKTTAVDAPAAETHKDTPPAQPAPPAKAERKRAPKKPAEPRPPVAAVTAPPQASPPASDSLPLEFSQSSPDDGAPSVAVSADGSTRLLVTAYIGIGNRLFIRGDGPGLSWDKGVPLQFVSIGKWRWETADATAPVKFKLFKNDEAEFSGLNPPPLEPGRQMEMTASV